MTDQQILQEAIEKTVANGWNIFGWRERDWYRSWSLTNEYTEPALCITYAINNHPSYLGRKWREATSVELLDEKVKTERLYELEEIIFNHDFARSLWGDEKVIANIEEINIYDPADDEKVRLQPRWQCHLQRMVLADDPIKYLGEHM